MAKIEDKTVAEMLMGDDTDPRQVALFLAQQVDTMDPLEREQRVHVLNALATFQTMQMARHTKSLAQRTWWLAVVTAVLAVVTVLVDVLDRWVW